MTAEIRWCPPIVNITADVVHVQQLEPGRVLVQPSDGGQFYVRDADAARALAAAFLEAAGLLSAARPKGVDLGDDPDGDN